MTKHNTQSEIVKVYPVPENPLTDEVVAHIEAVATHWIKCSAYTESDFEDICQVLSLAVTNAFSRYNCHKNGYYAFAQGVIRHTMLDFHRTYKNNNRVLLNATLIDDLKPYDHRLVDDNSLPPDEILMQKERNKRIYEILATLTPLQREVCKKIMDGVPICEIAEQLHLTRSQFYHVFWPRIQEIFKENLKNF